MAASSKKNILYSYWFSLQQTQCCHRHGTQAAGGSVFFRGRLEAAMGTELHRFGATILTLGFLTFPLATLAQSERQWVDPPADAGSPGNALPLSPATNAVGSKPASPQPSKASAPISDVNGQAKETAQPSPITPPTTPAIKSPPPRKAVAERNSRKPSRQASTSVKRNRQQQEAMSRAAGNPLPDGISRERRQGRGTSDLQVMTLRTVEFPDGRRMQFLTRPQPEAMYDPYGQPVW